MELICPLCGLPLKIENKTCRCSSGKVLTFYVKLEEDTRLEAVAGEYRDTALLQSLSQQPSKRFSETARSTLFLLSPLLR